MVAMDSQPAAPAWTVPPAQAVKTAVDFISETVTAAGASGLVVGLSGGVDSAVAAALATRALGPQRVLGLLMPYATSVPAAMSDARSVAAQLGLPTELLDITPVVDAYLALQADADRIRRGNVMARVRMIALYDVSQREGRLVLGTGNRSEWLLGYTTLHGDSACALNPLGDLYKTEIRLLAAHLKLPQAVRDKPPSADLWTGQADEDELGFTYAEADQLLHGLIDERLGQRQLEALGFSRRLIEAVSQRVEAMAYKRRLPPVAVFAGRRDPDRG
jgi:NAD+ synthase